nr:hypothetical protein [uncultured bacterium]
MESITPIKLRPRQQGFTLVELLVSLAVAGILSVVAIPAFTDLISNTRIENKSYEVLGLLKSARHNAIVTNNWSFVCRTNKAVNDVNSGGAACRLNGLAARDWSKELMTYSALAGTTVPAPNSTYNNLRIQRLESNGGVRKRMLRIVREAAPENVTINASARQNVIVFNRAGRLLNTAPFRIAVCDDRTYPEDFGRIIEINQVGQIRMYKTDPSNTDKDCTPTSN